MSYIGLDIGTSGCKASIVEKDGNVRCTAGREYAFESPQNGFVELNPTTVWSAVKEVLQEIAPYASDVAAMAVSSIGESMVIVDREENILYNGITYLDQRCTKTLPKVIEQMELRKLYEITGVSVNQMFTLNKFIWFRENCPEVLEKADHYFMFVDYFTYLLSGVKAVDPGSASRTMFFDIHKLDWSKEVAEVFSIPIDRFSPITRSGTILGPIQKALASELGLPDTIQIVMGIHDQCAANIGSHALLPGEAMMAQGSTESINMVINKNEIDERVYERELCIEPYIDEDHYLIITGNLTHGSTLTWFMRNFYEDYGTPSFSYDKLYASVPKDAGNVYFLPHLSEVNLMKRDNTSLGVFLGINVTTTKAQMFRAVLEGLCFETKVSINIFEEIGRDVKKIIVSGGTTANELYMQLKSDITGYPIHILKNPQAGIMGLSIICAVACKDYASYSEAADALLGIAKTYQPTKNYDIAFENYSLINRKVDEIYEQLQS